MSVSKSELNPKLRPYLKQYGSHSMAYSTLEPIMEYFVVEGVGYITYITYKHWLWSWVERKIVLSDPICDFKSYQSLTSQFVDKYSNIFFVGASLKFANVLNEMGYQVNQFGIETVLNLSGFDLKGKHRAKLRQWKNKCNREGVTVIEKPVGDFADQSEIKILSDKWLAKKGGEFEFLVRPLRFTNEPDVRYFWAYKDNKLVAFAVFDPIYKDGEVIAYYHNIDRMNALAPHGTSAFIILKAIEKFQSEDVQTVSLGVSPLCLQKGFSNELDSDLNLLTRKGFWFAFEKLNFLYPFKGNASHKNKFNGEKQPVYISSTKGTSLRQVFVMMKAIGLF